jgi:hypothetical protein
VGRARRSGILRAEPGRVNAAALGDGTARLDRAPPPVYALASVIQVGTMTDPEPSSELRFDRAAYAESTGTGTPCSSCKGPLGDSYWKWLNLMVCGRCRDKLEDKLKASQSWGPFAKTLLLGAGAAIGCGIAYAALVAVTKTQFALATIGIAIVVARVIRKASGGLGGSTRYRVAAVALTYLASTMGYIPAIWTSLQSVSAAEHAPEENGGRDTSVDTADAPAPDSDHSSRASPLDFAGAIVSLIGIMLAAPFYGATTAPFGLLIIGFGLWQAWKQSRGPPLHIEGPFRLEAAPARPDGP